MKMVLLRAWGDGMGGKWGDGMWGKLGASQGEFGDGLPDF